MKYLVGLIAKITQLNPDLGFCCVAHFEAPVKRWCDTACDNATVGQPWPSLSFLNNLSSGISDRTKDLPVVPVISTLSRRKTPYLLPGTSPRYPNPLQTYLDYPALPKLGF